MLDFWKKSSGAKKGIIIVAILVVGFIIAKWIGLV
jgi:hypothetical protein